MSEKRCAAGQWSCALSRPSLERPLPQRAKIAKGRQWITLCTDELVGRPNSGPDSTEIGRNLAWLWLRHGWKRNATQRIGVANVSAWLGSPLCWMSQRSPGCHSTVVQPMLLFPMLVCSSYLFDPFLWFPRLGHSRGRRAPTRAEDPQEQELQKTKASPACPRSMAMKFVSHPPTARWSRLPGSTVCPPPRTTQPFCLCAVNCVVRLA